MTAFNYFESEEMNFVMSVVTFGFIDFYIQFVNQIDEEQDSNGDTFQEANYADDLPF
ncbi:MAG: hypothetical protein IJK81_06175 [Selenomonadaceae bacterium]|nr:hypothetical protein [Selenomonadaceae bacterium]